MTTSITGQGIMAYKVPDDALSNESKNAVQNKVINGEVTDLQNAISQLQPAATSADIGKALIVKTVADGKPTSYEYGEAGGSGLTNSIKSALLACFENVAWANNQGATYYNALRSALYGGILPPEYQQVAFISATGSRGTTGPYIDTGVVPDSNTVLTVDFRFSDNGAGHLSGIAGGVGELYSRYAFGIDTASQTSAWYCGIGDVNTWNGTNDTIRHTFILDAVNKKFCVDSDEYSVAFTELSTTGKISLFARYTNQSRYDNRCSGELYRATIKKNDTVLRDLIPCYRIADNTPGLYDIISNSFFVNDGNGSFGIGDPV